MHQFKRAWALLLFGVYDSFSLQVLQSRPSCNFALAFLADIYAEKSLVLQALTEQQAASDAAKCAIQCFAMLDIADPIRRGYWRQRRLDLQKLCLS